MYKELVRYSSILKTYLPKEPQVSAENVNSARFVARALYVVTVLYKSIYPFANSRGLLDETDSWLRRSFGDTNRFSGLIEDAEADLKNLIEDSFIDWEPSPDLDIATLYENLLGIETGNEHQANKIDSVKHYRNKLGSYYTPKELTRAVTETTISTYLNANSLDVSVASFPRLRQLTFADFSCGAGNFLIAILDYFEGESIKNGVPEREINLLLQAITRNIHAVDVDCLALEVAKLSLLLKINQPGEYTTVTKNFHHANFLLQTSLPSSEAEKQRLFANGYIYHDGLAFQTDKLKSYDIILGNPPWEKIRFEKSKVSDIDIPADFKSKIEYAKKELKSNPFFALSNCGELNTYALFTEAAIKLKKEEGVAGLVVKSGLVTSQVNQKLFRHLAKEKYIKAIYDFINRKKIFSIDSRERYCFLLLGQPLECSFTVAMNLTSPDEIGLGQGEIDLTYEDLERLNPLSAMLPNFNNRNEAMFLLRLSKCLPFFSQVYTVKFGRIVHLNTHSKDIAREPEADRLPIYEGKFFHQFDGKYAGFNEVPHTERYLGKSSALPLKKTPNEQANIIPESRFYIKKDRWLDLSKKHRQPYMLAWRSLTSATNTRTCIATVLPFVPAIQSVQFLTTQPEDLLYLCGLFNSVVFDYIIRKKLNGIDLTQSVINQIPVPPVERVNLMKSEINKLVYSLLSHDERLQPLFLHIGMTSQLEGGRSELIRKLDLIIMRLYELSSEEVKLIISEFPSLYDKDDLHWFLTELSVTLCNQAVGASVPSSPTSCPV